MGRWDSSWVEAGNLIPAELEAGHLMKVSTEGRREARSRTIGRPRLTRGVLRAALQRELLRRTGMGTHWCLQYKSQRPEQLRTVPNGCTVEMTHRELSDLPVALV